ncbi:hypothetical protein Tco_1294493 [Tanacetum coccineum]
MMKNGLHSLRELRLALPMSDWKPQCQKRKRHFKWPLILSRTLRASRLSLSLHMSQKSLCSSSGILSRRTILDICLRVEGVNFTDVPDDDTTLAFLIKLGYKGRRRDQDVKICHFLDSPRLKFVQNRCSSSIPLVRFPPRRAEAKLRKDKKRKGVWGVWCGGGSGCHYKKEGRKKSVRGASSKRRVKKKVTLSADDNIIFDDPDTALELGESIIKTEAEEAEATRQWGSEQESEYSEEDKLDDEEKDDKEGDADDEDDETKSMNDDI